MSQGPSVNLVSTRPPPRQARMGTQYVNMLLEIDDIPRIDNLQANFFTWILLAGFVLFPGTFSSFQNVPADRLDGAEEHILKHVKNVSLFVIAWACTGLGAAGMCWLWFKWRKNYVWLVNSIFMPGFLNSMAGVISTLSSVYGTQNHQFSSTSKSTIIVTGSAAIICGILALVYGEWKLKAVKRSHSKEYGKEREPDVEAASPVEGNNEKIPSAA